MIISLPLPIQILNKFIMQCICDKYYTPHCTPSFDKIVIINLSVSVFLTQLHPMHSVSSQYINTYTALYHSIALKG